VSCQTSYTRLSKKRSQMPLSSQSELLRGKSYRLSASVFGDGDYYQATFQAEQDTDDPDSPYESKRVSIVRRHGSAARGFRYDSSASMRPRLLHRGDANHHLVDARPDRPASRSLARECRLSKIEEIRISTSVLKGRLVLHRAMLAGVGACAGRADAGAATRNESLWSCRGRAAALST
jgi:hypothetical protein